MAVAAVAALVSTWPFAVGALRFPARTKMQLSFSPAATFSTFSSASVRSSAAAGPALEQEERARSKSWLLVGLGNAGKVYERTRHNVGFEMVDVIAQAEGISVSNIRFKALIGKGQIGNTPVMLAKPQTFMNASGESVGQLVSYFKIPLNQVLLIYDDLDLPFSFLRLLPKGGHGGHNGMRSVINHFKGVKDFPRLRIGIGRPPGKMDAVNFVLRPFNKKEIEELNFTFQLGVEAARVLVLEGFDKSATLVNGKKKSNLLN